MEERKSVTAVWGISVLMTGADNLPGNKVAKLADAVASNLNKINRRHDNLRVDEFEIYEESTCIDNEADLFSLVKDGGRIEVFDFPIWHTPFSKLRFYLV